MSIFTECGDLLTGRFTGRRVKKQITNTMIQTFNDRIAEAEGCNVFFPQDVDLIEEDYVRGVYGFFKSKDGEEECFLCWQNK